MKPIELFCFALFKQQPFAKMTEHTTTYGDLTGNLREEMGVVRASVDAWTASQTRHVA